MIFFNGFPLSPTAFQISPTAFRFSSSAFRFPRNPRKSIYGKKYTKFCYSSFIFFATCSPSFVIPAKQYLHLIQHTSDCNVHISFQFSCHDSSTYLTWIIFLDEPTYLVKISVDKKNNSFFRTHNAPI